MLKLKNLCAGVGLYLGGIAVQANAAPIETVLIQAENYGNAYDTSAGNAGGQYRNAFNVDIEATGDIGGGYNVGWTEAGEWLDYQVTLSQGTYAFTARVASAWGPASFNVYLDGQLVGSSSAGQTGGWQNWQDRAVGDIAVTEGNHVVRVYVTGANLNLNWLRLDGYNFFIDSDNDGIDDKNDLCSATPEGAQVSNQGCPLDDDSDGVFNGLDTCPNTPVGESVNTSGCSDSQRDDDNDGIVNSLDSCLQTPTNAYVDSLGCELQTSNVALGKPASQSSTHPNYPQLNAARAVDGNTSGAYPDMAHNAYTQSGEWWQVDLQAPHYVTETQWFNRTDCCANRMNNYSVYTSLDGVNWTLVSHQTVQMGSPSIIPVKAQARFVRLVQNNNAFINFGEAVVLGTLLDADNDGVEDSFDQCNNTPLGATVDNAGCPSDSDFDNVLDGLDQCPNTPAGAQVNALGCAADTDSDGVIDVFDLCPITLAKVIVDEHGCGIDSDNDSVFDGLDQCANTPTGANVNTLGCPNDSDNDGIFDGLDQCDLTPIGANVNTQGCPSDNDGDGVFDGLDQCTNTPTGAPINSTGCALDSDSDGVIDLTDQCAGTPINASVNALGCPSDSDNDGVLDGIDQCPNTQTGTTIDSSGCPLDSDNDSVIDDHDQCPNTPSGLTVDAFGCATDSDGDGVKDDKDQCLNTPTGQTVDVVGCTLIEYVLLEAENYTQAYDTTAGNAGGLYRNDYGVDMGEAFDAGGGYAIGWTEAGEWLEYSVNLSEGTYAITARVASAIGPGNFSIYLDGQLVGSAASGNTGGWQAWQDRTVGSINVTAGEHKLRLEVTGDLLNLNWISLTGSQFATDVDQDGVIDNVDQCLDSNPAWPVNANGCTVDSDNDGIADNLDACPSSEAGVLVAQDGCIDSDQDGVADHQDVCTATPNGATVNGNGCPSDSDFDGVFDGLDQCNNTPQGETTNAQGCAPSQQDDDNDGVINANDNCPLTAAGIVVDESGCANGYPENGGLAGTYQIRNVNSGKCVEVGGGSAVNGGNVNQWQCYEYDHFYWTFESIGGSNYVIRNKNSGLLLDVEGAGATDNIQQWGVNAGGNSQRWQVVRDANGFYEFHALSDVSECLDIAAASIDNGANVQTYACNGTTAQKFTLFVNNPGKVGQWSQPIAWPHIPVSAANLPNGKILTWASRENTTFPHDVNDQRTRYTVWNPATGQFETNTHFGHDMFCAHIAMLPDGRVFANGGNGMGDINETSWFDYETNQWVMTDGMNRGRWYPTTVALPSGKVFTMIGSGGDKYPEIWTEGQGWELKGNINFDGPILNYGEFYEREWWPLIHLAPNGKLFHSGPTPKMHWIDPDGIGSVQESGTTISGWYPKHGTTVMYDEGKLITAGGALGGNTGLNGDQNLDGSLASTNRTMLIDLNGPAPEVREIDGMTYPRKFQNGVMAPNGEVMVFGGNTSGLKFSDQGTIYDVEIWNPETETWRLGAASSVPRNYHSIALLLTDGRVLSAGGGLCGCEADHQDAQIYSPAYLFNADGSLAERPQITLAPEAINAGQRFTLNATANVQQFSLIKMSSTTHAINTDLRYLDVDFTENAEGIYTLNAHDNINVLTPGYWMLFAINEQGTPSVARVIRVATESQPADEQDTLVLNAALTEPTTTGQSSVLSVDVAGATGNITYQWSFGDGSPLQTVENNNTVSHDYTQAGQYLVTVYAIDSQGNTGMTTLHKRVHETLTSGERTHSSSLLLDSANHLLWNVNPDNRSVSIIDTATLARVNEITLSGHPHTLAKTTDDEIWVAQSTPAAIARLDADTHALLGYIALPDNTTPYGIVFDQGNNRAMVTLQETGDVLMIDGISRNVAQSLSLGGTLRHLSYSADHKRVYVSRFITPALPGESGESPSVADAGGEVIAINSETFTVDSTILLQHSSRLDSEHTGRGIPNYLGAAVVSPSGKSAWVPSKQDNILRGVNRDGNELTHDLTVRSVASYIDLNAQQEIYTKRVDIDNSSTANAATYDKYGNYLFVALEGNRAISVIDPYANNLEMHRFAVGRAPQALVVSENGLTLYVHNFMDRTVGVYDLSVLIQTGEQVVNEIAVIATVENETLDPVVKRGKEIFYDAADTSLTTDAYMSCASCHADGAQDGRTYDFTQFAEGFRNTISLEGHGEGHGKLHWSANFDEVHDFEGQIREFAGGTGLMSNVDFNSGTRADPLGESKAGLSADLDALAAYVNSLTDFGISPQRKADQTLSTDAQLGQAVFEANQCDSCHSGAQFTDSAQDLLHDVGTANTDIGLAGGVDTPTLGGLWKTAPYLHDGSAATVGEAVNAHNGINISEPELSQLEAYLLSIDEVEEIKKR